MKWFYRLLTVVILVGAISLPFYADYRSGGSFLDLASIPHKIAKAIPKSIDEISSRISNSIGGESSNTAEGAEKDMAARTEGSNSTQNQAYYRWQDEHGQWHFSDQKPSGKSERAVLKPEQLSTISAMDDTLINQTVHPNSNDNALSARSGSEFSQDGDTPSLDNLSELVQNAQHAAQLMNERNQALNDLSRQ